MPLRVHLRTGIPALAGWQIPAGTLLIPVKRWTWLRPQNFAGADPTSGTPTPAAPSIAWQLFQEDFFDERYPCHE